MDVFDDRVVFLAESNYTEGVLNEPRVYYDVITPGNLPTESESVVGTGYGKLSYGDPDAFVNREEFPVWLSHMTAQVIPKMVRDHSNQQSGVGFDRRQLAGIGLQWRPHNGYYMSQKTFAAIPQWQNADNSLSRDTPRNCVTWKFDKPVLYSSRDTLAVEVGVMADIGEWLPELRSIVYVTFSGVGVLSGRPYYFGTMGTLRLQAENAPLTLDSAVLRNSGSEPVALSTMTVRGPDIDFLDIQVRQVGNGTNTDWFRGPLIPVDRPRIPISLLGIHGGQAVIHRFPSRGLLLEPGEGMTPVIRNLFRGIEVHLSGRQTTAPDIGLALSGYLMVT